MNYKKTLLVSLITIVITIFIGCPDVSSTNQSLTDNSAGQGTPSEQDTPDVLTIQKNSILISQGTETEDGVTYTVKSYATVYADCEYLYDYYRLYYLDNKVRKIVYAAHSIDLSASAPNFDYTYKEIDKDERYLKKSSYCFIYTYSSGGIITEEIAYYGGKIGNVTEYYESGNRKSYTYFETTSVGEKKYITTYYYDNAGSTRRVELVYNLSTGAISYFRYYYPSGYCQYYYHDGWLYEYEDEITTSGQTYGVAYKSKIVYDYEEIVAKFEQLIGEKVYATTEPDPAYSKDLISFTVVLTDVTSDAAAVALYCNKNDWKADEVNGSSVYIAEVKDGKATWTITDYPNWMPFSFQFVPLPGKNTRMGDDWFSYAISGSSSYNNNKNNITCDFKAKNKGDGCTITVNLDYNDYDGYWYYGETRSSFPMYGINPTRWFNESYESCFSVN